MTELLEASDKVGIIFFPYVILAFVAGAAYFLRQHETIKDHLFQIIAMGLILAVLMFMANKKLLPEAVIISIFSAITGYAFGTVNSKRRA